VAIFKSDHCADSSNVVNTLAYCAEPPKRAKPMLDPLNSMAKEYPVLVEEALEDEIAFWQSLIEHQPLDTPGEVIERMTQARMLAEEKLSLLNCKSHGDSDLA
jgi:hypothetical protein